MVKDKKTITFLQLFYYICCKDCDVFSQSDVGSNYIKKPLEVFHSTKICLIS
jgi:hypothetical protein